MTEEDTELAKRIDTARWTPAELTKNKRIMDRDILWYYLAVTNGYEGDTNYRPFDNRYLIRITPNDICSKLRSMITDIAKFEYSILLTIPVNKKVAQPTMDDLTKMLRLARIDNYHHKREAIIRTQAQSKIPFYKRIIDYIKLRYLDVTANERRDGQHESITNPTDKGI